MHMHLATVEHHVAVIYTWLQEHEAQIVASKTIDANYFRLRLRCLAESEQVLSILLDAKITNTAQLQALLLPRQTTPARSLQPIGKD
jgi:hypothetical protein